MNECLGKALGHAQRTREHVYVVVPDDNWPEALREAAPLLYRRATCSGRTWHFPDAGGRVSVVPVSEEPPAHPFTLALCVWAGDVAKWRAAAAKVAP